MKKYIPALCALLMLSSCAPDAEVEIPDIDTVIIETEAALPTANTESAVTEAVTTQNIEPEATDAPDETDAPSPETAAERPASAYNSDTIYLTFDDGPGKYTAEVLDILDRYGVKATFFTVGTQMKRYPDEFRMIAERGHSIGAHSMSHDYYVIYESPDAFADDLQLWEALSEDILGEVPKERLYRFPGGSTCTVLDAELFPEFLAAAEAMDYRCFDWTFANNDKYTKNKPSEQSMSDFLKASAKASLGITGSCKIMLLHETSAETVEMLPWLIEYLTDEGYTLSPLTYANKGYTFAK